jgi:hypothetical protein
MGMVRRRTRRRTMMVAGGMAYAAGRNRPPQEEPLQDEAAYGEPPSVGTENSNWVADQDL